MAQNPETPTDPADTPASQDASPSKAPLYRKQECLDLLAEIDEFQAMLAGTLRNPQLVETRQFRSSVLSELKMLQKLELQLQQAGAGADGASEVDPMLETRLGHALHSSNLPFYQAVWKIAKGSCAGLAALGKRFYWDREAKMSDKEQEKKVKPDGTKKPIKDKRNSVFVDVVAEGGQEWVKVSTISESRLLFEMAKKGWECDSEDEALSGDEGEGPPRRTVLRNFEGEEGDDDDDDELELIKLARDLRKAADATRVRYRHPRIRVVLPKIEEGNVPEIDDIIREMRKFGLQVECQSSVRVDTTNAGLAQLLPRPFKNFTPTLNIDCTLLLAMVSDLSHVKDIPPAPTFHRAILRQIEVEKEHPLLPTELWPAMDEHELVCTKEAATRMREIVQTIGTETEKTRMSIMMGDAPNDQLDHKAAIERFQSLSDYQVPASWKIPVRVIDAQPVIDAGMAQRKLPPVADEVVKGLSDINHSVFMYGWVTGMTTISSNRTVDKQIESTIENNRGGDEEIEGPFIWICDTARSLVGKEKDRKA